ncbi:MULTISPECIES: entericidin A/B family lipoprotein [unclassified Halomonas]|nr:MULTISPECIES: entericidin A/B family lipoprotein [unclassified Halomonas]
MKRSIASGLALLMTLLMVSGCNTFQGMGRDIEQGGKVVQDAAEE